MTPAEEKAKEAKQQKHLLTRKTERAKLMPRVWKFLLLVPAVSFIAAFFVTTPSRVDAGRVLQNLGLVAALVLSFVAVLPTCVTYEEVTGADQRFCWNGTGWGDATGTAAGYCT